MKRRDFLKGIGLSGISALFAGDRNNTSVLCAEQQRKKPQVPADAGRAATGDRVEVVISPNRGHDVDEKYLKFLLQHGFQSRSERIRSFGLKTEDVFDELIMEKRLFVDGGVFVLDTGEALEIIDPGDVDNGCDSPKGTKHD